MAWKVLWEKPARNFCFFILTVILAWCVLAVKGHQLQKMWYGWVFSDVRIPGV